MAPSYDVRDAAPDTVDMRDALWPVENVGQLCASAASAAATALEYHCNRIGEPPTNLSTLFIHYNARMASGQEGANVGTSMEATIQAITTYGACPEAAWPFDAGKLTLKPPSQAYDAARKFAAIQAGNPADVIESLALRYPVPVVGRFPMRCLTEAGRTGVMPAATADEMQQAEGTINHAMVVVGYNKTAKTFTLRNCWGKEWGHNGHCTVSFEAFKVFAPTGTKRLWYVGTAATGTISTQGAVTGVYAAAPPVPPAAPPPPAQPESLADMAARMRAEIRGDVTRDIDDATKRIRDMMNRNPAAPPRPAAPTNVERCPSCGGTGKCDNCGGRGCDRCSYGSCFRCGGRGML